MSVRDGRATAVLEGEFDMAATFTVEPALERVLEEPDVRELVVDLSRVTFVDSTGVGVLLRVHEESRRRRLELTLVPGPREVQRVFEIAGLTDALPFAA